MLVMHTRRVADVQGFGVSGNSRLPGRIKGGHCGEFHILVRCRVCDRPVLGTFFCGTFEVTRKHSHHDAFLLLRLLHDWNNNAECVSHQAYRTIVAEPDI